MKYYLIAGEASGDLHASNLMKALKAKDSNAEFRFWGGDLMQSIGGNLVTHYQELAFMGILEVLKNIKKLSNFIKACKQDIANYKPDVLILVDYSGFNLRVAPFAKELGIPTHFYIAPKLWAWNEKRVEKFKKYIDELYVIFPFEKDFFEKKHNYPVHYVGNPLQDVIADRPPTKAKVFREEFQLGDKPIIALLPGSRSQEIKKMLPLMVEISEIFTNYQFVIAGAPNREKDFYKSYIEDSTVAFVPNKTYDLLSISYTALVTSGTATLETALFKVPQVVCYKTSGLTYFIGNLLVKNIKYFSLVNLIMDAPIVTELLQKDFNKTRLTKELEAVLDPKKRTVLFENYLALEEKLGGKGASETVAKIILDKISLPKN
jgi:lipid-A-disaccharide synthase